MKTSKIKIVDIIRENWHQFKKAKGNRIPKEIRKDVYESVEKALYCGDVTKGYAQYICLNCGNTHKIGFTCKSKACVKCGRKYSLDWAYKQLNTMINVPHSHITFTIPSELRNYFYKNRNVLKEMQKLAFECIKYYYQTRIGKDYIPGVIVVLHTFGDDLKWNPHIHTLVTQGGIDKNIKWYSKVEHIPYGYLRKSWQKLILDLMTNRCNSKIASKMYAKYPKGFYVNVEKSIKNMKHKIKYLGRYLGRYPISETRIIKYDGKSVTYTYKEKTTRKKLVVTVDALDFIGKLIQHINKKYFKNIKRFGLYSRRSNKLSISIINLFNFSKQRNIDELLRKLNNTTKSFRERLIDMFSVDIKKCTKCNNKMDLFRIWSLKNGLIYEMNLTINEDTIYKNPTKENLISLNQEQLLFF